MLVKTTRENGREGLTGRGILRERRIEKEIDTECERGRERLREGKSE